MIICENCGNRMKPVYFNMSRKEGIEIYRCTFCKLLWAPSLSTNTSFQSKLDENNREIALKDIRLHEFKQVNGLVSKYAKKGEKGLDVGCAYGWYMKHIGKDYRMEGIEPENSIAEKARADGHRVYTGFFPKDMPKDAGRYDFIIFNNVWEHINQTTKLIKESVKFLKKGGIMVITVPLSTGGLYRISELFEKIDHTRELIRLWQLHFHSPHIYYFTKKNLTELMAKNNCALLECQDVRGIDLKRMKERFEMDADEKHGGVKAAVFRLAYPFIKRLPADKAIFVFKYNSDDMREGI